MSAPALVYQTSPIKRFRRTKAEITDIKVGLLRIVQAGAPMTVRQVFYRAVVGGLVPKTEAAYQNTVTRLLLEMRRAGEIPYSWISDNTRHQRRPASFDGLGDFIEHHQTAYRRDLWTESPDYVEVWCEKDALAGVLYTMTAEFDVPLMISRGFASESYLYSAADAITSHLCDGGTKERAYIYFLGDRDPSGLRISTSIERGVRRLCRQLARGWNDNHDAQVIFERVAVTEEQIDRWKLPTRPTKIGGNCHAKGWSDDLGSVELDAIPSDRLRNLVRAHIERHVDHDQLRHLRLIEAEERDQLRLFGRQLEGRP